MYFGHVICSDGLKADPAKVSAILNMPRLTNRAELETLLGMITYRTKFQRNLSEITSPMRALLHKDGYSYTPEGKFLPQKEGSFRGRKILYGRKLLNKVFSKRSI